MQITIQTDEGKKYIIPFETSNEKENPEHAITLVKENAKNILEFSKLIDWEIKETEILLGEVALSLTKLKTLKKEIIRYRPTKSRPGEQ